MLFVHCCSLRFAPFVILDEFWRVNEVCGFVNWWNFCWIWWFFWWLRLVDLIQIRGFGKLIRSRVKMGESQKFQLGTIGALSLSVVSSVSIVICNKALISTLGFTFGEFIVQWAIYLDMDVAMLGSICFLLIFSINLFAVLVENLDFFLRTWFWRQ